MKRIIIPLALCLLASCITAPSLDDLKEDSYPSVVQLLTEDDNESVTHRLDRYILDRHPDKLTYIGTVKVTEFTHQADEAGAVRTDSTKLLPGRRHHLPRNGVREIHGDVLRG